MRQIFQLAAAAALGAIASGSIVYAQAGSSGPPKARVALYRAAPGQQVALLKYLAEQDRASQAAGLPADAALRPYRRRQLGLYGDRPGDDPGPERGS